MLGIIGLHVLNAGGGLNRGNLLSPANIVLSYCYILCACSVDTFAMMTGYLYEGRKSVRYQNLLNLLATVCFYCVVITGCVYFLERSWLEPIGIKTSLFPFLANRFWYIACYVLLFVLIPYINILLNNINERQFDVLVILLLVMTSVLPSLLKVDVFKMSLGYSSAWLAVCYILGAYVKRKQLLLSVRRSIVLSIMISLATLVYSLYRLQFHADSAAFSWVTEYISPCIVVLSMLWINIFSKLTLADGKISKVIAALSAAAFDAYICHSHIMVYNNLITGGFGYLRKTAFLYLVPVFIASLAAVYAIGWIACKIREGLFCVTKLNVLLAKLGKIIDKIIFV